MFNLHGIYAPIPTPFENNRISYDRLGENLDFWLGSSLAGLVVMGSNGEFVLLSPDEKQELIRYVCRRSSGKKRVIVGTGTESTGETIRLCQVSADAGADAVLVISPWYYKDSMTEPILESFFLEVADASPLPVVLYNMPRNTGVNLSARLAAKLAKHPNIVGIKDSGGNIVQISEMIRLAEGENFAVFAGSASYLFASLALGAKGGTLALANIFPEECARVQILFEEGKTKEARNLQMKLIESNHAVTAGWGIAGLKAAMELIGKFGGEPRPPLKPLGEKERGELRKILLRTGFFPG